MPRSRIGFYLRSPLARHPFLAARKFRARATGGAPELPPAPDPAHLRYRTDPLAADRVRQWIGALAPHYRDLAAEEIFGVVFRRDDLLRWCRNGPDSGVGLSADIKTAWEFSRAQHMPLLAVCPDPSDAAARVERLAREIGEWSEAAADPDGPMWANPMEVAIRAINWLAADDVMEGRLSLAHGQTAWASQIHLHGRVIWARLEARLRSSNHYLANLLGLAWIARHFEGDPQAARWADFARREFPAALAGQTYPDGGAYEASLPYHALIAEMALLFLAITPDAPPKFLRRVDAMMNIVRAARRADGGLFAIGDDDSGRIFAVDRIATRRGRADALLALHEMLSAARAGVTDSGFFPDAGWWFRRAGDWHLAAHFGGVGFAGQGAHAHCDVFSLCADWRGQPVLIDPGSYLYTGDPAARNRFRSASAHSVFTPDGAEPYPIPQGRDGLFALPGRARAYAARARADGIEMNGPVFGGRLTRAVRIADTGIEIADAFVHPRSVEPTWTFMLSHDVRVEPAAGPAICLRTDRGSLLLTARFPARLTVEPAEESPGYGRVRACARIRAVGERTSRGAWTWTLDPIG